MHRFVVPRAIVHRVRIGQLTAADCRLLACVRILQAFACAALASLRVGTVRTALARIRPLAMAWCGPASEARVVWAFEASARWRIGSATCLARALAAEALLPPADPPPTMVIGVAPPTAGVLKSHAWIERDGRVLIGGGDSLRDYVPLVAWGDRAR
jgi:hypothetical protein